MTIATIVRPGVLAVALGLALLAAPAMAQRGGHHGFFGGGHHGHPINAWMGSHRPRLR